MLLERCLGFGMPNLTLLLGEVGPSDPYDFRQGTVIRLDLGRDMLALDKRRSKEDESVGRTGNVIIGLLLTVSWFFSGTIWRWREERAVGNG